MFDLDRDDDEDEDGRSAQDSWTLLILVLMYEHLQGESSRWKPYLDVLPSSFDTPMFWAPDELAELQASALVGKVGKEEADRMIRTKVVSVIREHENVFFPPGTRRLDDEELFALAHRMGSTIMAYAFDLENDEDGEDNDEDDEWVEDREDKTMLGMVPMADMLNADAVFNAHINHGKDTLTATALRTIRAGEEILNFYGPLSSAELLRRYGYVTQNHSRYDVVELPWALVEQEVRARVAGNMADADWAKVRRLVESDDEFEEAFVLERSSEDPDATGQVNGEAVFEGLPDELGRQFRGLLKAIKKVGNVEMAVQALEDKEMRKGLYLQCVLSALRAREQQYATTLEEDDKLLDGACEGRRRMAIWVRRGEKQLLREAQSWIRRQSDEDWAPPAKKRRL